MKHQLVGTACGLWLGLAGVAMAQSEQGIVVELYTSQGCSSCPPADALMGHLTEMPHVIGLALHVDYWDYIGWKDTFGQAKFTDRQRAYARAEGSKMIYTPQIIVSGTDRVEGNSPGNVAAAVARQLAVQSPITLSIDRKGNKLEISADADQAIGKTMQVVLVHYKPDATVDIKRGENAGQSVAYHNIVTDWDDVGSWDGAGPLSLSINAGGAGPVVVILQSKGPGEILAAARLQ